MNREARSRGVVLGTLAALLAAAAVLTACGPTSPESVAERNKRLVLRMNHEMWNEGNLERADEFFSRDFVRHFLPDGSELRGVENLREHERRLRDAFPDWGERIVHVVAEGDLVVIHFVSTGTNEGGWLGKPPTGRKIRIHEMSILRIEDGKIAEQWLLPDIFGMQRQLAPPEAE